MEQVVAQCTVMLMSNPRPIPCPLCSVGAERIRTAPPPTAALFLPFQLCGHQLRKVAMARSGVLPALSHLCLSGDRERQIHAVAAMANIAEMVEGRTQKRMIEEGCIKPLLGLVDSPDVSGRGWASSETSSRE